MYTIGQLRALVRNHYAENLNDRTSPSEQVEQDEHDEQVEQDEQDETLQRDESHGEAADDSPTSQENDETFDDDDDYTEIVLDGITYKVDGFKDVYNPEDMYHLGTLTSEEPPEIEWVTREARFLHMTNVEDNK